MRARAVFACALVCLALRTSAARSAGEPEPEYKIQYYVPQQQYVEPEEAAGQHQQQAAPQPRYISTPQSETYAAAQHARPQYEPPTHRVAQLLLPSAADRQVAKVAAQTIGPEYARQVQLVQQQGLANEAISTAQRRAQAIYLRAQQQQAQQSQHQATTAQRQQYLPDVPAPKAQYVQYVPQHQAQQYQLQYEQPEQYQPVVKSTPQPQYRLRPQAEKKPEQEEEEDEHDVDSSYQFGFDVKDDLYTNYQNRKEQREGGKISGSYSVVDSDGFIRTVTYTADPKEGFKAEVVRKPTDIVVKIPKPKEAGETVASQRVQHQHQYVQQEEEPQYVQPQQYQKYRVPAHQAGAADGQKQQIVYQYQ